MENAQLNQQNQAWLAEAKRAPTDQATVTDLRQQIEQLQRELTDCRNDLAFARRQAARQAIQPIAMIDTTIAS
jgi:hypothetical protein